MFTIMYEKEKHQILMVEKLDTEMFCLKHG